MPDYSQGKIYRVYSPSCENVYIGSTSLSLNVRMNIHRCDYKHYLLGQRPYSTCFEILKYADCNIELVKSVECASKKELETHEGEVIRMTPNHVNKRIEGRTKKEYREATKERTKERDKKYAEANKEKIREYHRKWRLARKLAKSAS